MKRTSILASITSAIFAISSVIVGAPSANASISLPKGSLLPCSAGGGAYCIESVSVTPSGAKTIALSWVATGSAGAAAGNTTNVAAGKTLPGRWTADAAFANENYDGKYFVYDLANNSVKTFEQEKDYIDFLATKNLNTKTDYKDFSYYYRQHWSGWRFFLLP